MTKTPLDLYRERVAQGDLKPDPHQLAAMESLQRVYDDLQKKPGFFSRRIAPRGVYLWGGVGRGKSMLMDMFYAALPDRAIVRRVHFHEFMVGVHDNLHRTRQTEKNGEAAILKYARDIAAKTKILCFDEFHVTDIADAMILGRLFTALFKHGVTVIATSNWPPDRLYQDGLQRALFLPFIDLLKSRTEVVEVGGSHDYRLQCLAGSGVYFSPLGAAASGKMDEIFAQLTGGIKPYEETLTVKGRVLHVEKTAKGVACFTFAQLCERPMGAEDYLSIARNYHTVLLEGVPKLGYDRRNEAKRLMTLVDAFYEAKTKLVISADAEPGKLYRGHDHAFEFQRTVSRLIEMQSPDYLKIK